MDIELMPLSEIRPYERNPRRNEKAVDAVAESIRRFGFRQPIVVDSDGVIVCGHVRWKAAQKLGLEKVPVHVARDLTPEQIRAYRIADNKTAELAEWNEELLAAELAELEKAEIDWLRLGFAELDLAKLLPAPNPDTISEPAVPAPPAEPVTQRGDVWLLRGASGLEHRLMCGDAGSAEDVDALLDGAPIHLVNTDPPYNLKVRPRTRNATRVGIAPSFYVRGREQMQTKGQRMRARDRPLVNDFLSDQDFAQSVRVWCRNIARVLLPGRAFYIWCGYPMQSGPYLSAFKASGLHFSQYIIWVKEYPVLLPLDFMSNHEWALYGWREGAPHVFFGPPGVTDVWSVRKIGTRAMRHMTEKPVELAARAIQYSSRPGENILDLFAGSGSTLIAAEQLGRRAFLMEIDPLYCDVIIARWEEFSGQKAQLLYRATPRRSHEENDETATRAAR